MDKATPQSRLTQQLYQGGARRPSTGIGQRNESITEPGPETEIDIRRPDGRTHREHVSDVSPSGLSIICKNRLDSREVAELRLADKDGPYERFQVIHVTPVLGGFKVGLMPADQRINKYLNVETGSQPVCCV